MLIEPKIAGASIVLLGNFNPAIFSPDWFSHRNLINENEILREDADFLIHPQIAQFKLDWCQVVAETHRFVVSTSMDPLIRIADLVVRTFAEFLPHTPLQQLGINREVHFPVTSVAIRDAVGRRLAPPDAWGDWAPAIIANSERKRGGMSSITMQQQVFDDERTGWVAATVQPSKQFKSNVGIFVQINDHYETTKSNHEDGSQEIIETLSSKFDSSIKHAEFIIDQVMRLADECRQSS